MNNKLVEFLNENKEEIFCYFKENSYYFPSCCVDIALMLKHFIKEYFNEDFEIIEAKKIQYANRRNFHLWLQKDDEVLDFSLFQLYIGNNKFRQVSAKQAYQYCIEEIQRDDVIFKKTCYDKIFKDFIKADSEEFLKKYQKSLWDFPINKELSAIMSLREYFESCKMIINNFVTSVN